MSRTLHYLYRHPHPIYFSLEKLFAGIGRQIAAVHAPEFTVKDLVLPFPSKWSRLASNMSYARKHQADINHITGDVHYAILACSKRNINILTIHDCVMLHHYPTSNPRYWILKWLWYDLPVRHADVVTVISENTKNEVLHFTKCKPEKIRVIPNFVDADFQPVSPGSRPAPPGPQNELPESQNEQPGIQNELPGIQKEQPAVLFIGSTPNKNLERLIPAMEGIRAQLDIVGLLSSGQLDLLKKHNIDYRQWSGLTRDALREKYIQCDMLAFPSTYEGFGLPIIEAQAIGRPVLTSDRSPMKEVAGDAACLVDPYDPDSIRKGVLRILNDVQYRNELVEKGFRNVTRFRLDIVTDQYVSLYNELLQKKKNGMNKKSRVAC